MYFLVEGDVHIYYPSQPFTTTIREHRLVQAQDKKEAEEKFRSYYPNKPEDYGRTYHVSWVNVAETIT